MEILIIKVSMFFRKQITMVMPVFSRPGFHSDVAVFIFYRSELMFSCKYIVPHFSQTDSGPSCFRGSLFVGYCIKSIHYLYTFHSLFLTLVY